ncbi:MAG TPA: hypothetical protein VHJ20_01495 [Polyangia bacterium]|nr:hypothetical protein [Polyangia bacterium]
MLKRSTSVTALIACLATFSNGCSLLFVTPLHSTKGNLTPNEGCTDSQFAPVVDGIVTALEVLRTIYAFAAPDSAYRNSALSRPADITLGLAFVGLYGGSMIYGISATGECRRYHERGFDDDDDEPARTPRPRGPVAPPPVVPPSAPRSLPPPFGIEPAPPPTTPAAPAPAPAKPALPAAPSVPQRADPDE